MTKLTKSMLGSKMQPRNLSTCKIAPYSQRVVYMFKKKKGCCELNPSKPLYTITF